MPLGWHLEAYKAQALAARSYGFTSATPTRDYDVRDDQSDQCYGGATVETTAGNAAVTAALGKGITYNGAAIPAYFASSSGGVNPGGRRLEQRHTRGPRGPPPGPRPRP